jgi:hypothetical protein
LRLKANSFRPLKIGTANVPLHPHSVLSLFTHHDTRPQHVLLDVELLHR